MFAQPFVLPRIRRAGLLLAFALLAVPLDAQQREPDGAKAIFYNAATGAVSAYNTSRGPRRSTRSRTPRSGADDRVLVAQTSAASSHRPGLHYWFELEGAGKVADDRVFHTGDRLRLHVRSNLDGYLTLWAYDPSGQSTLLFPAQPQGGRALAFSEESNFVRANMEYSPGVIILSPPAEDERLLIFFSESRDDVPAPQRGQLTTAQIEQATQNEGGKALLFEVERKDPQTFGSYVANRQGRQIAKEIRLTHRPRE